MSGNATLTIVMSSNSMNVPRQTATSVHHLSSAAPAVGGSVLAGRSPTAGGGSTRSVIVGPRPSTAASLARTGGAAFGSVTAPSTASAPPGQRGQDRQ